MSEVISKLIDEGRRYFDRQAYAAAETIFRQVLRRGYRYADIHQMLGVISFHKGDYEHAVQYLESALEINPDYTEAMLNLVVVFNELGRYDEARALSEQFAVPGVGNGVGGSDGTPQPDGYAMGKIANMHKRTAEAYLDLGLLPAATREYRNALSLCPNFHDIRIQLAKTLRQSGLLDEALIEYQYIISAKPDHDNSLIEQAMTLFKQGHLDQAKQSLQKVIDTRDNHALALALMQMINSHVQA